MNTEKNVHFNELKIISPILKVLQEEGYTNPTPIQAQSIPHLLLGKDLMGIAQTGTGKTAAFVLPILQRMEEKKLPLAPRSPRTLILAPTRELAAQIGDSIKTYGRHLRFRHTTIFGGVGQGPQVRDLSRGVDILVATPGRLLDLMEQRHVSLQRVEFFVLDEADRMLDMGFIRDIKRILPLLPPKKQSLFFSATMSPTIEQLSRQLLHDPVHVTITPESTTVERIEQKLFFVDKQNKDALLLELLRQDHLKMVLVFCGMKHVANKVSEMLNRNGIRSDAIHGNKSQGQRTKALADFKNKRVSVLVATDIAARGIDIDNISHVINYDLPNEPESYVHRIGRTARAGADGTAYSFCSSEERTYLRDIERTTRQKIEVVEGHKFHSEAARNATGSAARPPPRGGFRRGGGNRSGGFKRGGFSGGGHRSGSRSSDGHRSSGHGGSRGGSGGHGGHRSSGSGRVPFRRD
ncbi:MAG TPA: DEAD/DEAH box helicase [Acidobacteriota bacterium]|nr:DEAD/DEAH box helicase [Acidobacteriota bacterium]